MLIKVGYINYTAYKLKVLITIFSYQQYFLIICDTIITLMLEFKYKINELKWFECRHIMYIMLQQEEKVVVF